MVPQVVPALHIVGAVFAFIDLILSGIVTDHFAVYLPSVNFVVFNSVWSLLVIAYITLVPMVRAAWYRPIIALGLLAVTTIFWLSGGIAEAHMIGTSVCGISKMCQIAQASIAFSFFLLVVFLILTLFEGLEWKRSRGFTPKVPAKP